MSAITSDNRRRLLAAIGNIHGSMLHPSNIERMVDIYIAQRNRDLDPERFDQRMNLYLRAMEVLLLKPTGDQDEVHLLQIQGMTNMLQIIEQSDVASVHVSRSTIH